MMLRVMSLCLLLLGSTNVLAHQQGLPHHFLSNPAIEHSSVLELGWEYVVAGLIATVVFLLWYRISNKS